MRSQNVQAYLTTNGIVAVQHSSGFFYKITQQGTGKGISNLCSSILVKYAGRLTNGTVFDPSTPGATTSSAIICIREKQKKLLYKLAIGLPVGLVFSLPVLLSVLFHDWYKTMIFISSTQITLILITVFGIAVFFALFKMKFKWEENEQRYKELKFKQSKNT